MHVVNNPHFATVCREKETRLLRKVDRRIIKTKKSIRKAFNELLLKKVYTTITITEIAALADIDRKTFYLHYNSVDDILKEFQQEQTCKVKALLEEEKKLDIGSFFEGLNDIMMENIEIYRKLAKTKEYLFLVIEFKDILKDSITESFYEKSKMTPEVFNVYAEYIASGIVNIYIDWLNSDTPLTLAELTTIAKDAVLSGWNRIIIQ